MSAKDRYILAANQFAYQGELKNLLDANEGAFIQSISMGDYVRMLIDEGVLKEPPTKEQSEAYTKEALANNTPYYLNENPSMDWARNALDTITKLGVTSGSLTPNYDPKREVFVDWGSSTPQSVQRDKYNPNPLTWLSASPAGEASSGAGYQSKYQDSYSNFAIWGAGYDLNPNNLSANDLRVDSRQKAWDKALAAANNVWGSAENYQPVAKPSWGGAGTAGYYTQAEAQGGKTNFGTFVPKKPSEVGLTFEEFSDKQDLKDWQADKFRFGLEKPPSKRNAVGGGSHLTAAYDGYGNVRSQMPSINTVEEYIALRDSGELERLKGYSNLMRDNKALFDKSGKKLTEDNLGFNNYAEYRALDGLALETAEKRTWGYSTYYTAEALEDKTRSNHEGNLKEKGRRKLAASIVIGLATGGVFAAGGPASLASSLSTSIGNTLSAGTIAAAAGGAASGAVTGGLEGALKGAVIAGGGAAAGAWAGDAVDSLLGSNSTVGSTVNAGLGDSSGLYGGGSSTVGGSTVGSTVNAGLGETATAGFETLAGTGGSAGANYVGGLLDSGLNVADTLTSTGASAGGLANIDSGYRNPEFEDITGSTPPAGETYVNDIQDVGLPVTDTLATTTGTTLALNPNTNDYTTNLKDSGLPVEDTLGGSGGKAGTNYVNDIQNVGLPVADTLATTTGTTLTNAGAAAAGLSGADTNAPNGEYQPTSPVAGYTEKVVKGLVKDEIKEALTSDPSSSAAVGAVAGTVAGTDSDSSSAPSVYVPKISRTGGIFGGGGGAKKGGGSNNAPAKTLPAYNTGIKLNKSSTSGDGLLQQKQKRLVRDVSIPVMPVDGDKDVFGNIPISIPRLHLPVMPVDDLTGRLPSGLTKKEKYEFLENIPVYAADAPANTLPAYNTGIGLNKSNGNGYGLSQQKQKRLA